MGNNGIYVDCIRGLPFQNSEKSKTKTSVCCPLSMFVVMSSVNSRVLAAVFHSSCVSQQLCFTAALFHSSCVSQQLCFTAAVFHSSCVSQQLCFTAAVFHSSCVSQQLCFTAAVFHSSCVSQQLCFTAAVFHRNEPFGSHACCKR